MPARDESSRVDTANKRQKRDGDTHHMNSQGHDTVHQPARFPLLPGPLMPRRLKLDFILQEPFGLSHSV